MSIEISTPPAVEPFLAAAVRTFVGIGASDTTHDTTLTRQIAAARRQVEADTSRALITQVVKWRRDAFPDGELRLPHAPVQSVDELAYTDSAGSEQVLTEDTDFTVDLTACPVLVYPCYGLSWPSARDVRNAVRVTYTAGYGDAGTDVPEDLLEAIVTLMATFFESRTVAGGAPAAVLATGKASYAARIAQYILPHDFDDLEESP